MPGWKPVRKTACAVLDDVYNFVNYTINNDSLTMTTLRLSQVSNFPLNMDQIFQVNAGL